MLGPLCSRSWSIWFCMTITRHRLTALHTTLTHSSPAAAIAAIFHLRLPLLTGWFSAPGHDSSGVLCLRH